MIEIINKILGEIKPPKMTICKGSLRITPPEKVKEPAELKMKIKSFFSRSPVEGWICMTDRIQLINEKSGFDSIEDGIPLYGELVSGSESCHFRQSADGWTVHFLNRDKDGDMLIVEESFISTEGKNLRLLYETYWKMAKDYLKNDVYQPYAYRFAGFRVGKGGKDEEI